MFTYRCPACGKHHSQDNDFDQPFESRCLRCGAVIAVTAELVHASRSAAPARDHAITKMPEKTAPQAQNSAAVAAEQTDAPPTDDWESNADKITTAERNLTSRKRKEKPAEEKRRKKKPTTDAAEGEADWDDEEKAPAKPSWPPPKPVSDTSGSKSKKKIIVSVVALLFLVGGGAGAYFMFSGKGKEKNQPHAAKSASKTTSQPTSTARKGDTAKKKKKEEPPPQQPTIPETRDVALTAAQLSAEVASGADGKYIGKILDVSGMFARMETKDGLHPPAHPHLLFATRGPVISVDLRDSPTKLIAWARVTNVQPITVRGKYEKNGYLRDCALVPYTPTAESIYKNKMLEVMGNVVEVFVGTNQLPFPYIKLEGDTNSTLALQCFFRKTEVQEVSKIHKGSLLTIQGKCGGLVKENGVEYVRLDNCELVYHTAPPENMPRLPAARLLREYEQDQKPSYLPPPGQEQRIDERIPVGKLARENAGDANAFESKYGNRILRVVGKLQQMNDGVVYLESGDTDQRFVVECRFSRAEFPFVPKKGVTEYRIRGLYTGVRDPKLLRLDNCQLDMPRREPILVTADFFPQQDGRSFVVDVASFGVLLPNRRVGNAVRREVHLQGKKGLAEIKITQMGTLAGKSLFDRDVQDPWVGEKVVRVKNPETSGIYYIRLHAGFIELGTPQADSGGKIDIAWAPILKLDVEAGAKWKWDDPNGPHEYELERFEEYHGQPAAVVRESFTPASDVLHPIEILHVYAKGYGEVERREWRLLDLRKDKKLLREFKWVENPQSSGKLTNIATPGAKTPMPAKK